MTDQTPIAALIVDDDPIMREIYQDVFEDMNFELTSTVDGQEALDAFMSGNFQLVLLDLQMPKVDGRTFLRQVTDTYKREAAVIIVISATTHMITDEIRDLSDYVLQKPFNMDHLVQIIERLQGTM